MGKKAFLYLAVVVSSLIMTSCLDDDDTDYSLECAITGFTIDDLTCTLETTASDGSDSTYEVTIEGDDIYFNIDQLNNTITNVDSLVSWANVKRVVPTITSDGTIYYKQYTDSVYYPLSNGSDSLDFSEPVEFVVFANDGSSYKKYTATINVSVNNADSLLWNRVNNSDFKTSGDNHSVFLGDRLFVFSSNDGETIVTSTSMLSDGYSWSEPAATSGASGIIDYSSVKAYKGKLYALDSNGHVYSSTYEERGKTWTQVSGKTFESFLAVDSLRMYFYDGNEITGTSDFETWTGYGNTRLSYLPQTNISSVCYTLKTNSEIQVVVMSGLNDLIDDNAVVWYKVSSSDDEVDEEWSYIKITNDNSHPLPKMPNLQMWRYNGALYATGGGTTDYPYEYIYQSDDNGITWRAKTSLFMLPENVVGSTSPLSIAVNDNVIWMAQSGDGLWKGWLASLSNQ